MQYSCRNVGNVGWSFCPPACLIMSKKRSTGSWFIFAVNTYLKSLHTWSHSPSAGKLTAPALISGLHVGLLQSTVSEKGPYEFPRSRPVAPTSPATGMQILKHKKSLPSSFKPSAGKRRFKASNRSFKKVWTRPSAQHWLDETRLSLHRKEYLWLRSC